VPATADQVWSLVGDFHGSWHPAIETMAIEHDSYGRVIRAFTVKGEQTTYRERLTWHSNSERSMTYTHLEGIEGVQEYNASMEVTEHADRATECTVSMTAQIKAPEPRATEISTGTKAIFDDAIATIKTLSNSEGLTTTEVTAQQTDTPNSVPPSPTIKMINGAPRLAVSYIGATNTHATTPTDTLLLFLHGVGGNKSNWNHQLAAVSEHCTAAALDLRGYGDSTLGDTQSTVEDYCADILSVANALGAKQLILCGLSYGAWIATSFAVRHPERLAGLILCGGCTGMSEAGKDERDSFRHSREVPMSEGKTPADFASDVVSVIAGPDISDEVREALLESMRSISSRTYADALRCFTNPTEQFDFSSITMPVLLMTGSHDKLAPPQEIKQVAKRIHEASPFPDVRYECLEHAGHVCNLEAPQAFNSALIKLVQRVLR